MKKYLMMVVVALMATTGVKAQNEEMTWSFMPKVGWNLCTWAGDPDAKWMSGYMGGFEVEYGLSDNVGLVAGLNYSLQGEKDDVNKTKIMFGYTNVPLLVQYYPVKGLALKAGAQLGFLTSKKAKVDGVKLTSIGLRPPMVRMLASVSSTLPFLWAFPTSMPTSSLMPATIWVSSALSRVMTRPCATASSSSPLATRFPSPTNSPFRT
jgi:hypothetical protein